jgi:hypothetical protein
MGTADEAARVKQVRITSPWFMTAEKIHVGSTFKEIKDHYDLRQTGTIQQKDRTITVYSAKGMDVEIDTNNICTAIIIKANDDTGQAYMHFREEAVRSDQPKP